MISLRRNNINGVFREKADTDFIDFAFSHFQKPPETFTTLKNGSRSLVGNTTMNGQSFVLKYYYKRSLHHSLKYKLTKTRAKQSWLGSLLLESLSIPVASASCLLEESRNLLPHKSLLILTHVNGSSLDRYVEDFKSQKDQLDTIAHKLSTYFDTMRENQITHGDLKANNILLDEHLTPHFIDCDGLKQHKSQISFNKHWNSDKERFFKNWQKHPEIAALFHDVFDKTS